MKHIKNCVICGAEYITKSVNRKYCSGCAKRQRAISSRRSYYKKIGIPESKDVKSSSSVAKAKIPMFKFNGPKNKCEFDNCPFKSGKRPCLFYFEYKDGSSSCPGVRFMKGSD